MSVMIGIYQNREQVASHLERLGGVYRETMEVGPFASRMQALAWMDHMEARMQADKTERFTLGSLYPDTWYGATFEAD